MHIAEQLFWARVLEVEKMQKNKKWRAKKKKETIENGWMVFLFISFT